MFRPLSALLILSAGTATADLSVAFIEGAPTDRFELTNTGACPLPDLEVTLDLGTAPAGLIFDVTGSGAGVQVFQPFQLVAGAEYVQGTPRVSDGDTAVTLSLRGMTPGKKVAFTIDVDDTVSTRQSTIDGSEMSGATLRAVLPQGAPSARFDAAARAVLPLATCLS